MSKVGHSDLFLIRDKPIPQDEILLILCTPILRSIKYNESNYTQESLFLLNMVKKPTFFDILKPVPETLHFLMEIKIKPPVWAFRLVGPWLSKQQTNLLLYPFLFCWFFVFKFLDNIQHFTYQAFYQVSYVITNNSEKHSLHGKVLLIHFKACYEHNIHVMSKCISITWG